MKIQYSFALLCLSILLSFCDSNSHSDPQETLPVKNDKTIEKVQNKAPKHLSYSWKSKTENQRNLSGIGLSQPDFQRVKVKKGSFAEWLRYLPLFPKGHKVRLYDGSLKGNQSAHYEVIEMDVGKRDLQQCADAVMRLRSEYLYGKRKFDQIRFNMTSGDPLHFQKWASGQRPIIKGNSVSFSNNGKSGTDYKNFKSYLNMVFSYAGTASLSKELRSVAIQDIQAGDVFIQGGFPGHAVLVLDIAENAEGKKQFLLGQSYMPAQEFHLLRNDNFKRISPWYEIPSNGKVHTPEWSFSVKDLKRF